MLKKLFLIGTFFACLSASSQQIEVAKTDSKFSIIPSVGFATRLGKIPSNLPNTTRMYLQELKHGVSLDISAYYHPVKGNGALGLKYSHFKASNTGQIAVQLPSGVLTTQVLTTDDNIVFIGPSYIFSNFKEETRHKFFFDLALGVITYTTKVGPVKATGSNLGLDTGFAYQYAVTDRIFIGPRVGLTAGTLTEMKFNGTTIEFPDDQREGLTRLSLSAAATFRF